MRNFPLPRIDTDEELKKLLLPYCRFNPGKIMELHGHKIACIDAADETDVKNLMGNEHAALAVHDPPYNFVAFEEREAENFVQWCKRWIDNSYLFLKENSSIYIWLGADQNNHFEPFAQFILMMSSTGFRSRSFITMRNQRGYGTQKNWMAVRQELLYYIKGNPIFNVNAEYTDIPKILRGYYKKVNGRETENFERSKSGNIRAGNVWVDIQQVFYRMEENVNGCYAQKPLKAIERIIGSSSSAGDIVIDFFSHSGTTLIAAELSGRKCYTSDIDPVFCEISLRRLEYLKSTGRKGWQNSNPFEHEINTDKTLKSYVEHYVNNKQAEISDEEQNSTNTLKNFPEIAGKGV